MAERRPGGTVTAPAAEATPGAGRILTIPNGLSALRLVCIPLFVVLLVQSDRAGWWGVAILLGALGATDWVDGYVARHLGQVTTLGKVLDPLADRLLLGAAAIACVAVGAVPVVVAVLALARETLVAGGFVVVAIAGHRRMDVRLAGKAGTLGLMLALPLFLAGRSTVGWHHVALVLAWCLVVPALAAAWWSAAAYLPGARRAVAERRAAAR